MWTPSASDRGALLRLVPGTLEIWHVPGILKLGHRMGNSKDEIYGLQDKHMEQAKSTRV